MNDAPPRGAGTTPQLNARAARPSRGARIALAAAAAFFFCAFAFLGSWQVKRLQWKQELIARVDARVHADPVPAPRAAEWPRVAVDSHEYLRVKIRGSFLYDYTTRVQTTTALGIGFWLMTPLCTEDGIVFVNRGFLPMKSGDLKLPAPPVATANPCAGAAGAPVTITGLLRFPEPKGRLLRENDPAGDRWYTRDIGPMAARRGFTGSAAGAGMPPVAPYFIDAPAGQEHPRDANEKPTGGLTVIAFPNNHLVYALTWFGLAAMVAGGYYLVLRYDRTRATGEHDDTTEQ